MESKDKDLDVVGFGEESEEQSEYDDSTDIEGFEHLPNESIEDNFEISQDTSDEIINYKEEALRNKFIG